MTYVGTTRGYLWQNNQLMLMIGTSAQALYETYEVKRLLANTADNLPSNVAIEDGRPATHILVLGESTTRRHMSLYGYGRKTTPELDRLSPELEVATDACSSRGQTAPQVKELFTFATREDPSLLTEGPSLTQIMKAGSFKVYWLSNQQIVGKQDRWAGIFSLHADEQHYTNMRGWADGVSYDGQLLPILKTILSDDSTQRRFIVVHLLGTHEGYDLRYPAEYQVFNDLAGMDARFVAYGHNEWRIGVYNAYDNANLYNDHIVSEIIREAKKIDRVTVTYLSDHGEVVGEGTSMFGHLDDRGPRQMYEIPLLFYLGSAWRQEQAGKVDALRSNLGQPVQSDELIHSLLDLYGIQHPLKRSDRSLLSAAHQPKPRFCDTLQ
ncbi:phosphoethanolamine transferase [Microvirga roseola]|uniref:phosphoethanolamine transferase n=1 Tax=Microvirga roseola TaxID=2883126 RepID=UPI001E38C5DF|nr:phosphoethanolamine transferase [Microvirga roseola]